MITELSPHRYLPGPESFSDVEFSKLIGLALKIQRAISSNEHTVDCFGFNWSPFSWGEIEERGGCQSVMTKFHLMAWQWNNLTFEMVSDLPPVYEVVFRTNLYNAPFARLVNLKCSKLFDGAELFSEPVFSAVGLFLPFRSGKGVVDVFKAPSFIRSFTIIIEEILANLTDCLVDFDFARQESLLQETAHRLLNDEEIAFLRAKPVCRTLEEALSRCQNEFEAEICRAIYPASINRCTTCDEQFPIWTKRFGFSLTMCDSVQPDVIPPGLYIALHALAGPGGTAETVGCYLTRPEGRLADEAVMIAHNRLLWELSARLAKDDSL
jgi:hypothetical protein